MDLRTALDTNILSVLLGSPGAVHTVAVRLGKAKLDGTLYVSPFVYTEILAYPKITPSFLSEFLESTGVVVDLTVQNNVWLEAGLRYALYSRRRRKSDSKEKPRRIASDFLIGAHALLHADRLMTLDVGFYQTNYPELNLIPVHA